MPKIKKLSANIINKIAAGEVIERPLSVVKELVENALDAEADKIAIELEFGGRNLIKIRDNGYGIKKEQLEIALQAHTTSKLDDSDINDIKFLGFRGEALASIAAVSRLSLTSKPKNENNAWQINIIEEENQISPVNISDGTIVTIRDLFCYTPTRLKFLKSQKIEIANIVQLINKFALLHYNKDFKLISDGKLLIDYTKNSDRKQRLAIIEKKEFIDNIMDINITKDRININGWSTIPTYNKTISNRHYIYVNDRIVKDKFLAGAIKAAYKNVMPSDRYPKAILFIQLDIHEIDVNVHPTKTELRFKNEQLIRALVIKAIRNAIENKGLQTSTQIQKNVVEYIGENIAIQQQQNYQQSTMNLRNPTSEHQNFGQTKAVINGKFIEKVKNIDNEIEKKEEKQPEVLIDNEVIDNVGPLGIAKCQIALTYIVAQTNDGIVLVDQHAAHERLILEKIKNNKISSQLLLIPEVIELDMLAVEKLLHIKDELLKLGIKIERNGTKQIVVRELPVIFDKINIKTFFGDLIIAIDDSDPNFCFEAMRDLIMGNYACHNSIRAGKKLSIDEMNAILREMETTGFASQCNHGRPTYTKLSLNDLKKIFERC